MSSFSYMKLPPEIWCQICKLVLENEHDVGDRFHRIDNRLVYSCGRLSHAPRLTDGTTLLDLASTCRWMYNVAAPIYYSKSTFDLPTPKKMEKLLAGIGTINVNLITSIKMTNGTSRLDDDAIKLPWEAISRMANTRDILVLYPDGIMLYCHPPQPDHMAFHAWDDYSRFIECLSHEKHEQPEGTTRGLPYSSQKWTWMVPKVDTDNRFIEPGGTLSRDAVYSWGIVRTYLSLRYP